MGGFKDSRGDKQLAEKQQLPDGKPDVEDTQRPPAGTKPTGVTPAEAEKKTTPPGGGGKNKCDLGWLVANDKFFCRENFIRHIPGPLTLTFNPCFAEVCSDITKNQEPMEDFLLRFWIIEFNRPSFATIRNKGE